MKIKLLKSKDQLKKGDIVTVSDDVGKSLVDEGQAKVFNEKNVSSKTKEE